MEYRIKVKDANDEFIGEFNRFRGLEFNKRLNDYGKCSFQIPVNDDKVSSLISLRKYSVWVYRDDDLVWSGEQALREGDLRSEGDNWAEIVCYDWLELFKNRYTDSHRRFDGVDAGEIAWTLIDETQSETNGDFGITEGSVTATTNRDRSYYNQEIYQAIVNLANVLSGFDFEITNDKVFNVYSTKGADKTDDVVLEYGFNMKEARVIEDFITPCNRAIVLGQEIDGTSLSRVERNYSPSQGLYKLREQIINEMDVVETSTLNDKGDALLERYRYPLLKIDMDLLESSSPNITDFSLGDLIKVIINYGIYDIDESYRVFEWQLEVDEENIEKLVLILGRLGI